MRTRLRAIPMAAGLTVEVSAFLHPFGMVGAQSHDKPLFAGTQIDLEALQIFERSCRTCLSERTELPWYSLELTGLLTICAWCNKIRDEEGRWQQLESYISLHSDAKFTHGLCEECAAYMEAEVLSARRLP